MAATATSRKPNGHAEVMSGATFKPAKSNTEQAAKNAARMHVINGNRVKIEKKNGKWGVWVWPKKATNESYRKTKKEARKAQASGALDKGPMFQKWRKAQGVSKKGKKRNPESGAVAMREAFTGMPSKKTIVVGEDLHYHSHLAALGELVALKVRTIKGDKFDIGFTKETNPKKHKSALGKVKGWIGRRAKAVSGILKGQQEMWINPQVKNPSGPVLLCATEDGKQLYIEGGDQSLDLSALNMSEFKGKESVIVGEIKVIDYFATKNWQDGKKPETAIYTHKFNEDTGGPRPMLRYNTVDKKLYIDGGLYKINKPLFGATSAGLEN